jgi:nucleoside-diphosphate-sugar epimerase
MILVTGISGFIGKHVLNTLIKKEGASNILALTSAPINNCAYLLHHNYHFELDYFEKAGYHDITTVIHVGAFIPKN